MISIRYHLVTLVAVFLALGIGVVVGSTVIDRALVDDLERRVDDLDQRLSEEQAAGEEARSQLETIEDLDRRLAEQGPAALLNGDLDDVPVLVLAVDGTDDDAVGELADTLVAAGSRYQGTVWLTDRLALADEDATTALGELLGGAGGDAEAMRERLYTQLADELTVASAADAAGEAEGDGTPTGTVDGSDPPETDITAVEAPPDDVALVALLDGLSDGGFVRFDNRPDDEERTLAGVRIVVVSGAGAALADDAFVFPLIGELAAGGDTSVVAAEAWTPLPQVEGEPADEGPPRGVFVGRIRSERELSNRISTVDDLELFAGRAAVVLALESSAAGTVGHYGIGDGADALLPEP